MKKFEAVRVCRICGAPFGAVSYCREKIAKLTNLLHDLLFKNQIMNLLQVVYDAEENQKKCFLSQSIGFIHPVHKY